MEENLIKLEVIKSKIHDFYINEKILHNKNLKDFIYFIELSHIISTEKDYESIFNFMVELQLNINNENKVLIDNYDDIDKINIKESICIIAFDELFESQNQIIEKINGRNDDISFDIIQEYKNIIDNLFSNLFSDNIIQVRKYSIDDIEFIFINRLKNYKITYEEFLTISKNLFGLFERDKILDFNIYLKICTEINHLFEEEKLKNNMNDLKNDIDTNYKWNSNSVSDKDFNDIVENDFEKISIIDLDNNDFNVGTSMVNEIEYVQEKFGIITKENNNSISDLYLILDITKFLKFTINNQINDDLNKFREIKLKKEETNNLTIDQLFNNIKLIDLKICDIITFIKKLIYSTKLNSKTINHISNKINTIELEFKNLNTKLSYMNDNIYKSEKNTNDKENPIEINEMYLELSNYQIENSQLKEKIKLYQQEEEINKCELRKKDNIIFEFETIKNELEIKLNEFISKTKIQEEKENEMKRKISLLENNNKAMNDNVDKINENQLSFKKSKNKSNYKSLTKEDNLQIIQDKDCDFNNSIDEISYENYKNYKESEIEEEFYIAKDNNDLIKNYQSNKNKTTTPKSKHNIKIKSSKTLNYKDSELINEYNKLIQKIKEKEDKENILEKKLSLQEDIIINLKQEIKKAQKEKSNLISKEVNQEIKDQILIINNVNRNMDLDNIVTPKMSISGIGEDIKKTNNIQKYHKIERIISLQYMKIELNKENSITNFNFKFDSNNFLINKNGNESGKSKVNHMKSQSVSNNLDSSLLKRRISERKSKLICHDPNNIKFALDFQNKIKKLTINKNENLKKFQSINYVPNDTFFNKQKNSPKKSLKESESENKYDFLKLKHTSFINSFLNACNESYEFIYTSDIFIYYDKIKKESKKILITDKTIFILNHEDNFIIKKYDLFDLNQISISTQSSNLLIFHFLNEISDLVFEDFHRKDLILYIKLISETSIERRKIIEKRNLINKKLNEMIYPITIIKLEYSKNLRGRIDGVIKNFNIEKNKNHFTIGVFNSCIKYGYIKLLKKSIFKNYYELVFACLSNIGLIIFSSPNSTSPIGFYFLNNCEVDIVSFRHNQKNSLSHNITFSDNASVVTSNHIPTYKKESHFNYPDNPDRILFYILINDDEVIFQAPNKYEADSWVYEIKKFMVKNELKERVMIKEFYLY